MENFCNFNNVCIEQAAIDFTKNFDYALGISTWFTKHSVEKREIHCHANYFRASNQFTVKFFRKTLI